MLTRPFIASFVAVWCLVGAAAVQAASPPTDPSSSGAPSGDTNSSSASAKVSSGAWKVGATVKDSAGATVGKVSQVNTDSSGQPSSVVVKIGGKPVTLEASSLSVQGSSLEAQQTKSELSAKAPSQ